MILNTGNPTAVGLSDELLSQNVDTLTRWSGQTCCLTAGGFRTAAVVFLLGALAKSKDQTMKMLTAASSSGPKNRHISCTSCSSMT